jgi:hypothetical protein
VRPANTYRASRRNACGRWIDRGIWPGIEPGIRPRKPHNAAKLKKPERRSIFFITPILAMMVQRGIRAGTL